jgi:hypothetical protein
VLRTVSLVGNVISIGAKRCSEAFVEQFVGGFPCGIAFSPPALSVAGRVIP